MAVLLLGVSTPAHAASTGDLDLTGTVAAVCDLTVSPVIGVADNLPLGAAQTDLNVGSINETCNDPNGYSLSAVSANLSILQPLAGGPDNVPYTVSYGGAPMNLSGAPITVTNAVAPTGAGGVDNAVAISYSDPGFIEADSYSDTITFTITAK